MRLSKIYTKGGDGGKTMLANGDMVAKTSPRIEAYGSIDELNAHLGVLRETLRLLPDRFQTEISALARIQNEMHDLGGELATPLAALHPQQQVVTSASIARLEREIDEQNQALDPLANFVLPGGTLANAQAHVCRTVSRKVERRVFALAATEDVRSEVLAYLNRLSDWLFILSRTVAKKMEVEEVLWQQAKKRPKP